MRRLLDVGRATMIAPSAAGRKASLARDPAGKRLENPFLRSRRR